mmetsp:Transcript_47357/g.122372  ORF Transcript_47357/g.122372 Transcript_47357/m.122372 type:complete len:223 (-) Transcript_47357:4-672(-)
MVLAMALQYKSVLPKLKDASNLAHELQTLGLLTHEESTVLMPSGSRMRDTVLSWIARDVKINGPDNTGILRGEDHTMFMLKLAELRGKMMYFHGNNFYPQPNQYAGLMKRMVDAFCFLEIAGYPFIMNTRFDLTYYCLQPLTIISVFMMTSCFWGVDNLAYQLSFPFSSRVDTFNIDALIAGTEQTLFAYMRASFDDDARGASAGSLHKSRGRTGGVGREGV